MALSYSQHTVAGRIDGEIVSGREPLPWIMIPVLVNLVLWDRMGNRAPVKSKQRIVIQGRENIHLMRPRLRYGAEILATGQVVPSYTVANDGDLKGEVTLASLVQIAEPYQKKDEE